MYARICVFAAAVRIAGKFVHRATALPAIQHNDSHAPPLTLPCMHALTHRDDVHGTGCVVCLPIGG